MRTIVALLRELVAETQLPLDDQQAATVDELAPVFHTCVEQGDGARILSPILHRAFGWTGSDVPTAHDLWGTVINRLNPTASASTTEQVASQTYVAHGTLARRITTALGNTPTPESIIPLYRQLAKGAVENTMFLPSH